jgi:hypothetical protein
MEVIAAAGFCAPGCAAAVSAIAGGPILGAVGVVAAVGYGVYSLASGSKYEAADEDSFEDAIEDEEPKSPIVKIAKQPAFNAEERKPQTATTGMSQSFI